MSNLGKFYWACWIGIWTALYVILYLNSPLAQYGIIWVTFVALPIYFNGGAKRTDFFPQVVSSWLGIGWGLIMLLVAGVWSGIGPTLAMALSVGIFTIASSSCMILQNKHMINMVPAAFGGISTCFSQSGNNWWVIGITLTLGIILGLICNEGAPLCEKLATRGKEPASK